MFMNICCPNLLYYFITCEQYRAFIDILAYDTLAYRVAYFVLH